MPMGPPPPYLAIQSSLDTWNCVPQLGPEYPSLTVDYSPLSPVIPYKGKRHWEDNYIKPYTNGVYDSKPPPKSQPKRKHHYDIIPHKPKEFKIEAAPTPKDCTAKAARKPKKIKRKPDIPCKPKDKVAPVPKYCAAEAVQKPKNIKRKHHYDIIPHKPKNFFNGTAPIPKYCAVDSGFIPRYSTTKSGPIPEYGPVLKPKNCTADSGLIPKYSTTTSGPIPEYGPAEPVLKPKNRTVDSGLIPKYSTNTSGPIPEQRTAEPVLKPKDCTTEAALIPKECTIEAAFLPKDSTVEVVRIPKDCTVEVAHKPKENTATTPYYPHFKRGSLINFGKELIPIEDVKTNHFILGANDSPNLKMDPLIVTEIDTMKANPGFTNITFLHPKRKQELSTLTALDCPFFVLHEGWSSCDPIGTFLKYKLRVRKLQLGDSVVTTSMVDLSSKSGNSISTQSTYPTTSTVPTSSTSTPQICSKVPTSLTSTKEKNPDIDKGEPTSANVSSISTICKNEYDKIFTFEEKDLYLSMKDKGLSQFQTSPMNLKVITLQDNNK